MKLLITGFDAFGNDQFNPSFQAVSMLDDRINAIDILKVQLPTEFIAAKEKLICLLNKHEPDFVMLCGQAAGRKEISLERVAINVMDARIKDNVGYQPTDIPVVKDGPAAYFTNYDIRNMESACLNRDIPCKVSYSAGTYVCNSTYYSLLNWIDVNQTDTKGIFVHVPITSNQLENYDLNTFTMEIPEITEALETLIKSL